MSVVIKTHIVCDGCGKPFGEAALHRTALGHRENAKQHGWHKIDSEDYCADCKGGIQFVKVKGIGRRSRIKTMS